MGLFKSISKRQVENRLAGSGYRFLFGQTSAGKIVNERTAMQISAVNAAVRILSESIASLPLHVYYKGEDGSRKKAEDSELFYLLHNKPNPEMTSFIFRETLMTHVLLWGKQMCHIIALVIPDKPQYIAVFSAFCGVSAIIFKRHLVCLSDK